MIGDMTQGIWHVEQPVGFDTSASASTSNEPTERRLGHDGALCQESRMVKLKVPGLAPTVVGSMILTRGDEQQVDNQAEDPDDFVKKLESIRKEMAAEQAQITELQCRKRKRIEDMEEQLRRMRSRRKCLERQLASV